MLVKLRLLSAVALSLTLPLLPNALIVDRDAARITLPVFKRVNMTGTAKLLEIDQARARALRARAEGQYPADSPPVDPVTDKIVSFVANVGAGTPPTYFDLVVDTGSSNTWAGAHSLLPYVPNGRPEYEGAVVVTYGSGFFAGSEYGSTITLSPDFPAISQSIGCVRFDMGFNSVDGIFGIGPTGLTAGSLPFSPNVSIPTVTDNLYNQGVITKKLIGISFAPTTNLSNPNGELTFGYTNPDKYTGILNDVPITSTNPSSKYVGINQTTTYGTKSLPILPNTAGIVDTGTTLIMFAPGAYSAYKAATNAMSDSATGLLKIAPGDYAQLKSLFFEIGGFKYELTANGQTWPRALNTAIGGQADGIYLAFGDLGSSSSEGLGFILGQIFLQRFYHFFDSQNNRAGFATTPFTNATSN